MGKRQPQNSHRRVALLFFLLLFLFFYPPLPRVHDPVINLAEISRSLINACLFPRLYRILGVFFLSRLSPPSVFHVFVTLADEDEVMFSTPPTPTPTGEFFKQR